MRSPVFKPSWNSAIPCGIRCLLAPLKAQLDEAVRRVQEMI